MSEHVHIARKSKSTFNIARFDARAMFIRHSVNTKALTLLAIEMSKKKNFDMCEKIEVENLLTIASRKRDFWQREMFRRVFDETQNYAIASNAIAEASLESSRIVREKVAAT